MSPMPVKSLSESQWVKKSVVFFKLHLKLCFWNMLKCKKLKWIPIRTVSETNLSGSCCISVWFSESLVNNCGIQWISLKRFSGELIISKVQIRIKKIPGMEVSVSRTTLLHQMITPVTEFHCWFKTYIVIQQQVGFFSVWLWPTQTLKKVMECDCSL